MPNTIRFLRSVDFIRCMVGSVFLSEGIQMFLYPDRLGPGRFARIGIPWPRVLAPFVGDVEIVAGAFIARRQPFLSNRRRLI
jgi:uncharacterized membrane protein YphA (DoxX/SURF4 family)